MDKFINTKVLMIISALFMGVVGLGTSFIPEVILANYGAADQALAVAFTELIGALYIGFAVLNWMAKDFRLGRPIIFGNFLHFGLAAIMLLRNLMVGHHTMEFIVGGIIYTLFAIFFVILLFSGDEDDSESE